MVLKGIFVKHRLMAAYLSAMLGGLLSAVSVLLAAEENTALAVTAAVCGFLCAAPFMTGFAGLCADKHTKLREIFAFGALFGAYRTLPGYCFLYAMAGADWISLSSTVTALLVTAAILVLTLQSAVLWGLGAMFLYALWVRQPGRRELFCPPAFALIHGLIEFLQGILPASQPGDFPWLGLPWLRQALAFTGIPLYLQGAALGGSLFVGGLAVLIGAWLGYAVTAEKAARRFSFLAAVLLLAAMTGAGQLMMILPAGKTTKTVSAAVVQGNLDSHDKWSAEGAELAKDRYITLTMQGEDGLYSPLGPGVDLVLWPESAVPLTIERYPELDAELSALALRGDFTLLTGLFHRTEDACYTSAYAYSPDGERTEEPYSKQALVPFGEYVPGGSALIARFPALAELNLFGDPLTAGENPSPLKTDAGRVGVLLCFDTAYASPALDEVRYGGSIYDGAEYFACLSNTAWFADTAAGRQMLGHAALRCAEFRREMLVSSSTGISAVIGARGDVRVRSMPGETGVLFDEVTGYAGRTVFSYPGENGIAALAVLGLVFLFIIPGKPPKKGAKSVKNRKNTH
ncbi:MAG: apolipoprotein N-acyltransferase [Clostridia bacterium]|nr:apolipoprotein N-acyltransferase [Clostridia bacterium]